MQAVRRDWSPAEDNAVFALRALGWSGTKIAAALDRSPISLERHLHHLRKAGSTQPFRRPPPTYPKVTPADRPIEGETWSEVPARGLCVSSHGRVISSRSGYLRSIYRQALNGKLAVNYETKERRGTITLENLMREARGDFQKPRALRRARSDPRVPCGPKGQSRPWYTSHEDDTIRKSRNLSLAQQALPHRPPESVRNRVKILGLKFTKWEPAPAGTPARGKADLAAARAVVPKWLRPENREDLINDIVMMQLEGFEGTAAEAFKIARVRHHRLFDEYRHRPIDAVIPGTDRLRLSDTLSSDEPHF